MPKVRTLEQIKEAHMRELDKNDRWKRENTKLYQMRVAIKSGIPEAIDKMNAETGIAPAKYLRQALMEKLKRDGYIAEIQEESEE